MLDKSSIKIVTKHAITFSLAIGLSLINAELFATKVGLIENNGNVIGKNPHSSARGLYQFLSGSIPPAITRATRTLPLEPWMQEALIHRDANRLTKEQQTTLFLADIFGKRGSEKYTKRILEGDKEAMLNAYLILHHTSPDEATKRRARRIIYEE